MNEQEWKDIGNQAQKVREELFNLHRMTTGKMPVAIIKHITKSIADLDQFKNMAEARMMNTGASTEINIFYGRKVEKVDEGDRNG